MALHLKVTKSFSNCVLKRREIELCIKHDRQPTPQKEIIRKELCTNYSVPETQIYVYNLRTGFGSNETNAMAHIYSDATEMREIVLPYVLRKITGEEIKKIPRRQRKDARKKKAKIFGTMKRNMQKAAKRNKD
ncbi:rps24e [Nucleospora cyclopteri]